MTGWRERFARGVDGTRLFLRDHDVAPPGRTPVVCLPGLTRTSRDFGALASRFAPHRRVICPDMRGRGRSDRADAATYSAAVEAGDVISLLDGLGVERAVFVGVSRGGFQTMAIAHARPDLVAGAALVDVGPVVERPGLARILSRMRAAPEEYLDWAAAAAAAEAEFAADYPDLDAAGWLAFARRLYRERDGRPARDWDPALIVATERDMAAFEAEAPPDLWPLFDALAAAPVVVIRGALSDVLSAETVEAMIARRPDLAALTVRARGHPPLLDEPEALAAIDALLERVDAARVAA